MASPAIELEVGERLVRVSNPDKILFPERGETKLDLVRYYLSVGDGIVRALRERPTQLRRFPDGVEGEEAGKVPLAPYLAAAALFPFGLLLWRRDR